MGLLSAAQAPQNPQWQIAPQGQGMPPMMGQQQQLPPPQMPPMQGAPGGFGGDPEFMAYLASLQSGMGGALPQFAPPVRQMAAAPPASDGRGGYGGGGAPGSGRFGGRTLLPGFGNLSSVQLMNTQPRPVTGG